MSTSFSELVANMNGDPVTLTAPAVLSGPAGSSGVKVSPGNPLSEAGIPLLEVATSCGKEAPFNVGVLAWNDLVVLFDDELGPYDVSFSSRISAGLQARLSEVGIYWETAREYCWALPKPEYLELFVQILKDELGEPLAELQPNTHAHDALTDMLGEVGLKQFACE